MHSTAAAATTVLVLFPSRRCHPLLGAATATVVVTVAVVVVVAVAPSARALLFLCCLHPGQRVCAPLAHPLQQSAAVVAVTTAVAYVLRLQQTFLLVVPAHLCHCVAQRHHQPKPAAEPLSARMAVKKPVGWNWHFAAVAGLLAAGAQDDSAP